MPSPIDTPMLGEFRKIAGDAVLGAFAKAKGTQYDLQARAAGAKTCLDGLGMLVCQGAESFRLWTGLTPDVEPVLARVRTELNA